MGLGLESHSLVEVVLPGSLISRNFDNIAVSETKEDERRRKRTTGFQLLAFLGGTRHTPSSVAPLKIEQVRGFILCKVELNKLWLSPPENQFT